MGAWVPLQRGVPSAVRGVRTNGVVGASPALAAAARGAGACVPVLDRPVRADSCPGSVLLRGF